MTKIDTPAQGNTYSPDTKQRIIEVASIFFAKYGYDNSSIRDISKEAGVNVASINYHFKNKIFLFKEVMDYNMVIIENDIKEIANNSKDMKDFTWKIFTMFTEDADAFINSFKLFITNTLPEDMDIFPQACSSNNFGPPGQMYMLELLNKEVPANIPLEKKEWAVRILFGYIAHISLIFCSTMGKMMCDNVEHMQPEHKRKALEMHTEAILNYLKQNAE